VLDGGQHYVVQAPPTERFVGGLGGGALGAVGGAAGAGLSSKLADQTKAIRDAVSDAADSTLLGNIAANIVSGLGGALVGGSAGAAGASNVNLYNAGHDKNDTEAKKEAQELKQALDKERAMLGQSGAKVPSGTQAARAFDSAGRRGGWLRQGRNVGWYCQCYQWFES
jgi:filamentous hemagglutinin